VVVEAWDGLLERVLVEMEVDEMDEMDEKRLSLTLCSYILFVMHTWWSGKVLGQAHQSSPCCLVTVLQRCSVRVSPW